VPRPSAAIGAAVAALALALAPLTPVAAADRPDTISLVTGSSPEGITAGPGTTFFAGARADGAVYAGDVRRRTVRELVPGQAGAVAVGLLYDAATKRIWVAGGTTGTVTAYDSRTGRLLFSADVDTNTDPTDNPFLNDVAITRDAVHVTDSTRGRLVVIPLGRGAALPAPGTFRTLPITGDYVQPDGFGLNGIRVLPGGDLLAVSGGRLYVIDPATGVADRVAVRGATLTGGDGLVLRGTTLYVVRGFNPRASVVVLRLGQGARTATYVREIVDPDFNVPTTAALVAGDLLVVNGQFRDPADAPTEVVGIDRP